MTQVYLGTNLAIRTGLILLITVALGSIVGDTAWLFSQILMGIIWVLLLVEFVRFIHRNNRIMSRFISSLNYRDFDSITAISSAGKVQKDLLDSMKAIATELQSIKTSHAAQNILINAVSDRNELPLFVYRKSGEIIYKNKAFMQYLNREVAQIAHLKPIFPEIHENLIALQDFQIRTSQVFYGDRGKVRINVESIHVKGDLHYLVEIIPSERSNTEETASKTTLNVLSHEVRNGITPILSLSETLQDIVLQEDRLEASHQVIKGLQTIRGQALRLDALVEQQQSSLNIPLPNKVKTSWHEVFNALGPEQEHLVAYNIPATSKLIYVDKQQLVQVFINLIRNAQAFESPDRSLRIEIEVKELELEYQVVFKDNGSGIEPSKQRDIFIPFVSGRADGKGLGLSISRKIIENHDGRIRLLHSDGSGTSFVLYLPMN